MISPAAFASIQSALISYLWGLWSSELTVLGVGYSEGNLSTPQTTLAYIAAHWWTGFIVATIPAAYRARQGYTAATSIVNTPTYTSVPKEAPMKGSP